MSGHSENIEMPSDLSHEPTDGKTVPFDRGSGRALPVLWMHESDRHPGATESFRALKNKLLALKKVGNLVNFVFTGCEPGVGTSTVVFNLALVLAQDLPEQRVLLVDTNIRRPTLHQVFDIDREPGLTNALLGNLPVGKVIHDSFLTNLDIIPVGQTEQTSPSPYDLNEFSNFLDEARSQYGFVLFDSAPALQSSQTRSIYAKTDGVVMVAEADRTHWEVVTELKRQLSDDGANLIGAFLNKRKFPIPKWLYQYI